MKIAHRKGQHKKKVRLREARREKLVALGVVKAPAKASAAKK
jgi:hypothetical protein